MGPPMVEGDLRAAVEALLAGTASRAQHHLVRETLAAGHFAQAPGERAVSVGGNADGAIISTGNDAAIFSMVQPDPEAVRQAVASVFKTRLHQLPPDLADFTGREREADELVALLGRDASGAIISAVGGMGGVGKSALAIHVAHQLTGRYPDGQLFLELGGTSERTLPPAEAMARVIRSFEPAAHLPDDEGEIATIYRSTLAGKRVLLVLDNARDAAQVRPLVPPTGCAMIVTSRRVLALSGVQRMELGVLSEVQARALLEHIIGPGRAGAVILDEIARMCGRLPMAVRVAGTFLAVHPNWPVEKYAEALSNERQRLRRLRVEDNSALDVVGSLRLSETQLAQEDPGLAVRWRLLSVFPASFDEAAVATVWEAGAEEARDGLSGLAARSMVIYDAVRDRYRLHDLMRDVARGRYMKDEQDVIPIRDLMASGAQRHATHFYGELMLANLLYMNGGEASLAGLQLFDVERDNIEAALAWAAENSATDRQAAYLCLGYIWEASHIMKLRHSAHETIFWANAALDAAQRCGEREHEAGALNSLGVAYASLGDIRRATEFWSNAVEIARENKYSRVDAIASANIASLEGVDTSTAIAALQRSASIAKDKDDHRTASACLGNLAILYRKLGDPRRAIEMCNQSLTLAGGDPLIECTNLGVLANSHLDIGEDEIGINLHKQRLEIAHRISDYRNEIDALICIGQHHVLRKMYDEGIPLLQQAVNIARSKHHYRKNEATALSMLGYSYGHMGENTRAVECFEQELPIQKELGNAKSVANTRKNLASAYANAGEYRTALNHLERCRTEARASNDPQGEAEILSMMINVYSRLADKCVDQEDFVEGLRFYETAATIAAETGSDFEQGKAMCNSARILAHFGREDDALARLETGTALLTRAGAPEASEAQRLLERVRKG